MGGSSSGSSSSGGNTSSGGGWGNSPHGNPHGLSGASADSHGGFGGGFSGQTGVANRAGGVSVRGHGLRGGLLANDAAVAAGFAPGEIGRARSGGFSSGSGGGNTVYNPMNPQQPYGLGMNPDDFWAAYEERYGRPYIRGEEVEQAQGRADQAVQGFDALTNQLLGQFEQNWRNTFGGQGDMFPHRNAPANEGEE